MLSTVIQPVILSGGSGTRLWPLSREAFPKQLLCLYSSNSMLQDSALRVAAGPQFSAPIVVCNQEHRFIVAEQLREIGQDARAVVIEPVGRNTAPAAAVAALLMEAEPETLLLVMPSDHVVTDSAAFRAALDTAAPLARQGKLVTFGIIPSAPETGYGYIKRGDGLADGAFAVERFVEKPSREVAETYLAAGDYLWNSGIFLFSAGAWLKELDLHHPGTVAGCRQAMAEGQNDLFFFRLGEAAFSALRGQSIDYAVMEKTAHAAVVPVDMGWSDIGSWSALWQISDRDTAGNAEIGDVVSQDCQNSYLRSDGVMLAALGVQDLVVVATDDVVLVADKSRAQELSPMVARLKKAGRPEATTSSLVYRPWGWFRTLAEGNRFKVKQISVKPGERLSLQKHLHRSEHWVVVQGCAQVTNGERVFLLHENESTFIPSGHRHRLENPGKLPLIIVEVQSGSYLGEDDIIREDDVYGRVETTL